MIPTLHADENLTPGLIAQRFSRHQLLYIPHASTTSCLLAPSALEDFLEQHAPLPITIEQPRTGAVGPASTHNSQFGRGRFYKTMVLEPDTRPLAFSRALTQLLPKSLPSDGAIDAQDVLWVFFGENPPGGPPMQVWNPLLQSSAR